MATRTNAASERLGEVIDRCRGEIERRWLERVQRDICRNPGIELTRLRDGLPDYLVALVQLLGRHHDRVDFSRNGEPAWSKVAREHAITRVQIGFDIGQLVHEFVVLRQVIAEIAAEQGLPARGPDAMLADSLDGAIATSVKAYVDARDYEARKKQAENIGFLTHELRNPLSACVIAASQLRRVATPQQLGLLDTLERNQKRISDLIESVLLTERLEAGKVEVHPIDVELEQVMEPALELARGTASTKGVAFRAPYDHHLAVHVDPVLTRSAIQNLADNAAKYTDHGDVELTVDEQPEALVIHVRDSCDGISAEELRTIFEPFTRGATGKSGTGLGLAIAKRAVEAQGGSIHADSAEGSGCHFWIKLPKRTAA